MADNTELNLMSGGNVFATDEIGGVHYQRTKLTIGADGVNDGDVSASNPLPIGPSKGTPTETVVSVATTSTSVLASNASRKFLQIINDSDEVVYIAFDGAAAVAHEGTRLNPEGGAVTLDRYVPTAAIKAIHEGTGNKKLLVTEG